MKFRSLFDSTLIKFLMVGVCNTLLSAVIMFVLYNIASFGYWGSSAVAYVLASVFSFFLNRNFTFKNKGAMAPAAIRFAINIAICYVVAYLLAEPLTAWVLNSSGLTEQLVEQIAMLVGMVFFSGFNYLGQRFFAFRSTKSEN